MYEHLTGQIHPVLNIITNLDVFIFLALIFFFNRLVSRSYQQTNKLIKFDI